MQSLEINLSINAGGVWMLMAQHRTDLGKRGSLPQYLAGEPMAKLMRSIRGSFDHRALQGTSSNRSHVPGETTIRRSAAQKEAARGAGGATMLQIGCDRFAHLRV